MKKVLLVLLLLSFGGIFAGCSSAAIPSIVLRRMNDVGVVYKVDVKEAECAIIGAIKEIGCEVRYINRTTYHAGPRKGELESITVNGKIPNGGVTNRFFVVDVDPVFYRPEWHKIRIGIGDFGNHDLAIKFHKALMRRLSVVQEKTPECLKGSNGICDYIEPTNPERTSDGRIIENGYVIEEIVL